MMENLQTITQVTKAFGVSTRTLRYYEQLGLLESQRVDGYAYRVYSPEACARLRQIIILRKLRIPLKQIKLLLGDRDAQAAIDVFTRSLDELDAEITSLQTIREILRGLVARLQLGIGSSPAFSWLDDENLLALVMPVNKLTDPRVREKTMAELNNASEVAGRLADKDVRVVYLPPSAVAAYQADGEEPELHVAAVVDAFILESGLAEAKPDFRHFGFNSPDPDETGRHGYEIWVTVPSAMAVPEPLVKKQMPGGLYAAHAISFGAFEEWQLLYQWLERSQIYAYRECGGSENMYGCLEEMLNYINHIGGIGTEAQDLQMDLLLPIMERGA